MAVYSTKKSFLPGVVEIVSVVLVIFVASSQDDALAALLRLPSNAGHRRAVNSLLGDMDPLQPEHAHLDAWDGPEVVLGDLCALFGPTLTGKTFAPVSTLSSLLLGHLD